MRKHLKICLMLTLAAVLLGAVSVGTAFYIDSKKLVIEFFEDAEVNVNEPAENYQFVKKLENGEIITERSRIDTGSVGERAVYLTVRPVFGPVQEFHFTVSVVDREGPLISFPGNLEIDLGKGLDLLSGVSASDNSGERIAVTIEGEYDFGRVGEYKLKYTARDSSLNETAEDFILSVVDRERPVITFRDKLETEVGKDIDLLSGVSASDNSGEAITVTVEGGYDINKAGEYALKYVACDSSRNRVEECFTLKVKAPTPPPEPGPIAFTTSKGYRGVIIDGVTYIEGYLIANKTYALPKSYGKGLTDTTKDAFDAMKAAAKEDGLRIYISSGFRSYRTQRTLYNNYVKRDGAAKADTFSARPGHSEHQSGLAFDVNIVSDAFIGTPEAIWLADNCYKFGFILRYPQGKTNETGYKFEPWHFRYVGVELAGSLYNGGDWLTMEDYFGIASEYIY